MKLIMCHYDNININNYTAGIDPLTPGTGVNGSILRAFKKVAKSCNNNKNRISSLILLVAQFSVFNCTARCRKVLYSFTGLLHFHVYCKRISSIYTP